MPPPRDSRSRRLIPIVLALSIIVTAVVLALMIVHGMRTNPREGVYAPPASPRAVIACGGGHAHAVHPRVKDHI